MANKAKIPTKVIGIRVPVPTIEEWETLAKNGGVTLAAYVLARAMRGGGQSSRPKEPVGPKQADLDAANAEIAKLKRELAKRPEGKVLSSKKALAVMRGDPRLKTVKPSADGKSLLPASLPVHTDFPARPVRQRGDGKGNR